MTTQPSPCPITPTAWGQHSSAAATVESFAALVGADASSMTGADLVDAIVAGEKALSLLAGVQIRMMNALAAPFVAGDPTRLAARLARKSSMTRDDDPEQTQLYVDEAATCLAATEVAAALRISPVTAGIRVREAAVLTGPLSPTLDALEGGVLDRSKARVITEQCRPLQPDQAAAVQDLVLPSAGGLSTGELRDLTAHAVITIDPDGTEERHQEAAARRELTLRPQPDAMANLSAYLPADGAVKIFQISDLLATSTAGTLDDPRGIGARRIDALVDIADQLLTHGYLDLTDYIDTPLPDHGTPKTPAPQRDTDPAPAQDLANTDPSPAQDLANTDSSPAQDLANTDSSPARDQDETCPSPANDRADTCPPPAQDLADTDPLPAQDQAETSLSEPDTTDGVDGSRPDVSTDVTAVDLGVPAGTESACATGSTGAADHDADDDDPPPAAASTNAPADTPADTAPSAPADTAPARTPSSSNPPSKTAPSTSATEVARQRRSLSRQGRRPHLSVVIGADTLTGRDNRPATLAGFGAIPAGLARSIAQSAGTVTALFTDPGTGAITQTGALTYRPKQELRDQVAALFTVCQFPSCRQPVWRCDMDHRDSFNQQHPERGGRTTLGNTGPFCRRHHLMKHHTEWQVRVDPRRMVLDWLSPTRHRYHKTIQSPLPAASMELHVTTGGTALAEHLDSLAAEADRRSTPGRSAWGAAEEYLTELLLRHQLNRPPLEYQPQPEPPGQNTGSGTVAEMNDAADDLDDTDTDTDPDHEAPPF